MDDTNISRSTWSRNIAPVNKIGYMDGAADGQAAEFQSSFDMGYKQGLSFGMEIGYRNAMRAQQDNSSNDELGLRDQSQINCQFCVDGEQSGHNVFNLYNTQQEKNTEVLNTKM